MNNEFSLQGVKNFRDFGGYKTQNNSYVKKGVLFRSAGLSELTLADQELVNNMSIASVCDLRRQEELERSPTRWPEKSSTQFYHLPFFNKQSKVSTGSVLVEAQKYNDAAKSRQIMLNIYRGVVLDSMALEQIKKIFQLLTQEENLPLLIHCSGGKDRTGISCALILTLMEVNFDDIMADYMMSLELYTDRVDTSQQSGGQMLDSTQFGGLSKEALIPVYRVEPEYLQGSFDAINETYGGVENFFQSALALSDTDIERIRENLTA